MIKIMKFVFDDHGRIDIRSLEDLARIIPKSLSGKALNYGQGEGQVLIEGTIWGIYVQGGQKYCLQYEEGTLTWQKFQDLANAILAHISSEFALDFEFQVEGQLEHFDLHEKYLSGPGPT